jgi:nitroreductase
MQLLEVIRQQRAVRQFLARPVERATLERLIQTSALAPSAMNLQPWAYAVIAGVARIDDYARRAKQLLLDDAAAAEFPAELRAMLADPATSIFHHAPVLVLVLARTDESQAREDCCLAAQTLLLAARDAGLGTCWIGLGRPWLNRPETKAELGIPAQYHVVAPVVMGHPVAWPPSHGRNAPEIYWVA